MMQYLVVMKLSHWSIALAVLAILIAILAFVMGMLIATDQFMQAPK